MTRLDDTQLAWSPAWMVERAAGTEVVLTAGADRRIAVDGLSPRTLTALRRWEHDGVIAPTTDEERALVDRLGAIGAITTELTGVALAASSGEAPGTVDAFAAALAHHDVVAGEGDLVVVLRVDDTAITLERPHLAVDLRVHHTVVLGPFVVPGLTACVGCLDRRMARRWPAAANPPRPAVHRLLPAVAALTAVQIRLALAGTSPLANATATWDLETATSTRQALWKTPGCPTCDTVARAGRVTLP